MAFPCSHKFTDFLRELPKCEHHVHLEGTLEPSFLFKLAQRNHITLPSSFPKTIEECKQRYDQFADLQDFLDFYYIGMSVLVSEQDFYELAMMYFEKAHHDGCLHSEVFFDPQSHLQRGVEMDTVVSGFDRACHDATAKFGTSNKLIMCLLRHLPASSGLDTIKLADNLYQKGVIHGLGLDSSEKPFPPELFTECYSYLKNKHPQVGLTAHAGEEGDYTYVENALDLLHTTRIDHGIHSRQSEKVMHRLSRNQTMLTVCPLSNVKLQVVNEVGQLPIKVFLEKGVPFSINSDDPAYFGGYILDNYVAVQKSFALTAAQWKQIVLNGINGSWCSHERKQELTSLVDVVCGRYSDLF
ncbi:uncharacterized protein LODBEIA_P36610 [Lodderomyces beijingensis]|uniref:Adenine deaminase n=1 Tax=Lodderomyces beijingensis TaxID=1775926 RepID=A0ABP0ZT35_9ASCO